MRLLIFILALVAAASPATARDWSKTVKPTAAGAYVMGNPAAKARLVEYLSYTCPHCAAFAAESAEDEAAMVRSGTLSVELRNAVRDKLDLAAAALARCTGPANLFATSAAIFAAQPDWYPRGAQFEQTNARRMALYPEANKLRALADGSGLTAIAKAHGLTDAALDDCFTPAALAPVLRITSAAWAKIDGTPAFELNGKLIERVGWNELAPMLRAAGAK